MSIAYEINRLKLNKQQVKEQVNVDKDIIYEGREFIRDETVRHYPSGIKSMEMSYKDFIPVHTSTESLIETERGGTIIERRLMGNTTQDGTPTPSSLVAINNVTGLQNYSICGKNLFDGQLELGGYGNTGAKVEANANYRNANTISVEPSTTYTFSINGASQKYVILFYDINGNFISQNTSLTTGTFTTLNNAYFINFRTFNADFVSDFANLKVQLEKGSTATAYEPYKLAKKRTKNLFDKYNVIAGYRFDSEGGLYQNNGCNATNFIDVQPNTTYSTSWSIVWNEVICLYDAEFNFTRRLISGTSFTTEPNEYYIRADVTDEHLDTAQIAKGTSEVYEPYQGKDYEVNLGKNLLKLDTVTGTKNGVTYNWEGNKLTLNGTTTSATDIYNFGWWGATTKNNDRYLNPGTYTLSIQGASNVGKFNVNSYYGTTLVISLFRDNTSVTKTLNNGTYYSNCYISILSNKTFNNEVFYIQLEKNNTMTSYSPYFTPIELNKIGDYQDFIRKGTGKNLLNTNKMLYGTISQTDGITISDNSSVLYSPQYIEVKPNTRYTLSCKVSNIIIRLFNYEDDKTYINTSIASTSNMTTSFTTSSNTYFIRLQYNQSFNVDMQLEEGSFTYYEPYNYGGKWYIEKNIEKVVLNGSESYTRQVVTGDVTRFMHTLNVAGIGGARQTFISNYFVANLNYVNDREGVGFVYGDLLYLYKEDTTVANFQTWLSTHNTIVYYVLSSPTFETISNSTLISQLNENIYLLEGQNNISVSGNLPTGIDVDYIERVNKHLIGNTNESAE